MAKLQLHTNTTLNDLKNSATQLGNLIRIFKTEVCSQYATQDLPSEEAACGQHQAAKAQKAGGQALPAQKNTAGVTSKFCDFNMATYKLHGLPDYPALIRAYGVTENTSAKNVHLFLLLYILDLSNIATG